MKIGVMDAHNARRWGRRKAAEKASKATCNTYIHALESTENQSADVTQNI
ncbi:hypothetical protein SAMN04488502_101836 [Dendrosporobacter quercicolus]|uniref:Uncharacterized protein n=1 Tax=Dendrosporobacter quercicolus TaxID=146817 RepID=A0A1G9MY29_9FIRM|nr:hypothetical protein SAMN04488502_101836 [Dendrosporobacter quercicolus]